MTLEKERKKKKRKKTPPLQSRVSSISFRSGLCREEKCGGRGRCWFLWCVCVCVSCCVLVLLLPVFPALALIMFLLPSIA